MSSGTALRHPGTMSQQGTSDFLQTASSITEPDTDAASNTAIGSANPGLLNLSTGYPLVGGPMSATSPVAAASAFSDMVTSGNFSINLEFDAAAAAAPSTFQQGIEQAASLIVADLHVNNAITLNIEILYGENNVATYGAYGGQIYGSDLSYTDLRNYLTANAPGDRNFQDLPTGSSVIGFDGTTTESYSTLGISSAQEKVFGIIAGDNTSPDGDVNFGTGIPTSELTGVALHELTHTMGREAVGWPAIPNAFGLFRFYAPGTIFNAVGVGSGAPEAYFSVDGGATSIAAYGTISDPADFLNNGTLEDSFTEYYDNGTPQTLTALDLQQMDVLGFSTACFAEGTRLATLNGPMPVEAVRPGTKLLTIAGAVRPVRWVGYRRLDLYRHPAPEEACPIRIRAGALEEGVPVRDLRLSPEHALFLDGGLVPARLLVNGCSILRETACRHVVWYHVEPDTHDLVLAEGAATETYLDTGNRGMFENADVPLVLHPDFGAGQAVRVARSCAPLLDDPARVEPIWRRLADRSAATGLGEPVAVPATTDPDLAVRVDGQLFRPVGAEGSRYVFMLPPLRSPVRLLSRASAPIAVRPWVADSRRLGLAVSRLTIRHGASVRVLTADDPALSDGWFAVEQDTAGPYRWTNGDAALPLESSQPAVLEVVCQPLFAYVLEPERLDPVRAVA